MIRYIITGIVFLGIIINYYLGISLYKEPKNDGYFSNVSNYNIINRREIMASPRYVTLLSILLGIFLGVYMFLCQLQEINSLVMWGTMGVLVVLYLVEITRKVSITEDSLQFERIFTPTKKIPLNNIDGMFVYSYNKKFLNKRAFTTKLVVTHGDEKFKFTLSSIDVKAIINMMKDNFGVEEYKMYVHKKSDKVIREK